jgi:NAD(P)H-hydrate epimerase
MAGGTGKAGAGILAAKSCLRSGCGLLTMVIPSSENVIFQAAIPEAMTLQYDATNSLSNIPIKTSAVAAGPGIGTDATAMQTLTRLIERWPQPMVADADAINLLSQHQNLLHRLPKGSLLTPHVGEFERLAGKKDNDFDRLEAQLELSKVLGIYILLKGAFTKITTPEGKIWVNPTGNAGMAKGGSGDILTGLIAGLSARGYTMEEAAILGAYLHGLAGDLCAERIGMEAMHAGDLIEMIPEAWKRIQATTFN